MYSRTPTNRHVRRQLFPADDVTGQASVDNLANNIHESLITELNEKSQKWNFDFANEKPLDGTYEWVPTHGSCCWTGTPKAVDKIVADVLETKEVYDDLDHNLQRMQDKNEITPKTNKIECALPVVRKRSIEDTSCDSETGARRKIRFD